MKQAKTFTEKELKQVLTYVSLRRHALRNRAMVLLTHWAGMRVGEVAALLVRDVLDTDGSIKSEIRLAPEQTKGRHARTVFLGQKLRRELAAYVASLKNPKHDGPLFYTQKRAGFTANTLCQYFHWLYKEAGIQGASSHSGRRSFITNLASKGVGVRVLMSLAGHRDISTTQRYIDVNDDMQRKAVDLV
ncbi:TPA: tyrosine-type recombinase/integrase [Burkholderia cenocepacia]|uniref:tyrosine-type recombinase/integrase n=1 Tax=Burkholderia cenocepacia TaxID=95486 RepID=UPI002AB60A26|nr:tyrosine-type recombinase/integrase [Burkholderia cenocepacia]